MNRSLPKRGENGQWLKGRVSANNCICVTCCTGFRVKPSKILNGRGKFCSKKCKAVSGRERLMGDRNPRWNGGKSIHTAGYVLTKTGVNIKKHKSGYVFEHRLIMQKEIGRELKDGEVIHHINGDKKDNRIENLELMVSQSEHAKLHLNYNLHRFI